MGFLGAQRPGPGPARCHVGVAVEPAKEVALPYGEQSSAVEANVAEQHQSELANFGCLFGAGQDRPSRVLLLVGKLQAPMVSIPSWDPEIQHAAGRLKGRSAV